MGGHGAVLQQRLCVHRRQVAGWRLPGISAGMPGTSASSSPSLAGQAVASLAHQPTAFLIAFPHSRHRFPHVHCWVCGFARGARRCPKGGQRLTFSDSSLLTPAGSAACGAPGGAAACVGCDGGPHMAGVRVRDV